jgi:hypothetical protein
MRTEQLEKATLTDIDLDAIWSDVYAAEQCHQHCSNLVWRHGSEFVCNLAATTDQPVLSSPISVFIADDIEDRSLIGEEGLESGDDQALKIGGRYPPTL